MNRLARKQERLTKIGTKCCNCGSTNNLQYHHIIPLAFGGNDIDSNLCCLCEDCHGLIHGMEFNNHSELIKRGQAKAKDEGKNIGQIGNILTITMEDGNIYKGSTKEIGKIFNRSQRAVELWIKKGITDNTKKRLHIKDITYEYKGYKIN